MHNRVGPPQKYFVDIAEMFLPIFTYYDTKVIFEKKNILFLSRQWQKQFNIYMKEDP